MNVFDAVKPMVTTKQAAEMYGIRVKRNGMAVCPFHNDKNPSMKVDRRFHCFACQADGDAIDFVSKLFGLPVRDAAIKLADDFGINYDNKRRTSIRPPYQRTDSRTSLSKRGKILLQSADRLFSSFENMGNAVCSSTDK